MVMPAVCILDDVLWWQDLLRAGDWQVLALEEGAYDRSDCADLGHWFKDVLLPRLQGDWRDARLFMINANLKFLPTAHRQLRHGIELLQHIRLTRQLPRALREAHVVLYSFESEAALRGHDCRNLIIYSPGVTLPRLPEGMKQLADPDCWKRWIEQPADLNAPNLAGFFRFSLEPTWGRLYAHRYRNRAGVAKFVEEFAGDLVPQDHSVLTQYREDELSDLTWKRLRFTMPRLDRRGKPARARVEKFRQQTRGHRFLFIDDEHARGWYLGFYAGWTGRLPLSEGGCVPDVVQCLSSPSEALELITRSVEALNQALQRWRDACRSLAEAITAEDADRKLAAIQNRNLAQKEALRAFPYSLVLLDLRLEPALDENRIPEELSGWQVLQSIKQSFPQVPVILFTASEKALNAETARRLGADGYWLKGVSSGEKLRQMIEACLNKASLRRDWIRLRLIREMPQLRCRHWKQREAGFSELWLDEADPRSLQAKRLLEHSYWLLWDDSSGEAPRPGREPSWRLVISNLGVIQEIRWQAVKKWGPLPQPEREIHGLRIRAVHAGRSTDPDWKGLVSLFRHTVDDLIEGPGQALDVFLAGLGVAL